MTAGEAVLKLLALTSDLEEAIEGIKASVTLLTYTHDPDEALDDETESAVQTVLNGFGFTQ
jgi:hypothetical protein